MIGRLIARGCSHLARSASNGLTTEISTVTSISRKPGIQAPISSFIRYSHHLGPQVQQPAPGFKGTAVVCGDFKEIDLCDFRGKYLVLFFYPLDFTFVCPTEIIAFSDHIDEFKAINTEVVGVSCDSHFSHLAWINTPRKQGGLGELKYPLLSDFNKTVARDYNVLLESEGVPLRGLFIIDPQGVVRQITVNDLPVGRSVDEVLRLVKAFQFTDEHGEEACIPAAEGKQMAKCTVPNIKSKSPFKKRSTTILSLDETDETKSLSIAQLERLVLLDQLKVYRMQIEGFQGKKELVKKEEKSSEILLQERDCIAV